MIAAHLPVQRPRHARLLVVDAHGRIGHRVRDGFVALLNRHDLVVANDAATLPASLHGRHVPTGADIEVRLASRGSLDSADVHRFVAVVFGAGDFQMRTEDRPQPPALSSGDRLVLGPSWSSASGGPPLSATIESLVDHPRLIALRFDGSAREIWAGLARHGRPIQYAHVPTPLALWDVWTPIAGIPAAFEPPSAGFVLDWASIRGMRARGIGFATITLAAGLSSTGDPELDRRLPFDEPYRIPDATAAAIQQARRLGHRIVAIGTTVVRALEHAGARDGVVHPGDGLADERLGPASELRVVDAILSGTHEPESSHYQLLRAFADDATLAEVTAALEAHAYRTHEFGDSMLVERRARVASDREAFRQATRLTRPPRSSKSVIGKNRFCAVSKVLCLAEVFLAYSGDPLQRERKKGQLALHYRWTPAAAALPRGPAGYTWTTSPRHPGPPFQRFQKSLATG